MAENRKTMSREEMVTALSTELQNTAEALPTGLNVVRFANNAIALLYNNDKLREYASKYGFAPVKIGLMKGAYLGLDFMNEEAHLVPFGSELKFMMNYRGAVKLVKKYSIRKVKDVYAEIVREGDEFQKTIENGEQRVDFKPLPFNGGDIIGAFAVCMFEDGGLLCETMSLKELENTRKASKNSNTGPWKLYTSEMYKKTVLHRLCKHIEIEFETPNQTTLFKNDIEIETDVVEQSKNEAAIEANSEPFVFDENEVEGVADE